ncbi:AbrB/MazE/SpoVT family DNA-binding domain-containing protein [Rhizobium sp. KVB221]|uniref:AbrB/MazE/SpoVT family DNA-binding domain-containing protein n=1 Tax=Rhizobium setariae TaxID=2801340 RepID=A0A936YN40_9HYPH|nr:AbrB/MazE/SpoVT family DNA-binding domain-containing protein [Rhizobium setariae]MBL0371179.1 AbrB/MazE/SpoVT family DNA-binding domain-containing protein [Rhizobium setariae]
MGMERHVKVFRNGRNRAVRIPVEFEFPGDEVIMRKEGDRIILEPVKKTDLLEWLAMIEPWDEDFPDLDERQAPPEDVNL